MHSIFTAKSAVSLERMVKNFGIKWLMYGTNFNPKALAKSPTQKAQTLLIELLKISSIPHINKGITDWMYFSNLLSIFSANSPIASTASSNKLFLEFIICITVIMKLSAICSDTQSWSALEKMLQNNEQIMDWLLASAFCKISIKKGILFMTFGMKSDEAFSIIEANAYIAIILKDWSVE